MPVKILIIADHPATAQFISGVLAIKGFESVVAPGGQIGIDKAREEKPALIFLDVMLPGLDGIETCRKLKECPETSNIPKIIISIWKSAEDKKRGFEAGCVDYIVKPFEIGKLIEAARKFLPK